MNDKTLLNNIRILDLSRVLAGPYCTMMLGDLGAEVIKIEALNHGDDTRHWGPPFSQDGDSAYYLSVNRNKKSITLNLKTVPGRKILQKLISKSDVVIENFKVGTMEKWDFGYENLQKIRPGLIYCTITGFGYSGPYKDLPGYDFIIQALGGLMSITGPPDGPPSKVGVAVIDIFAGLFASNAILAALLSRASDGKGHRIDISLLDCGVAILANQASNYLVSGIPPVRQGNAHPNIVPYEIFQAKDGYFAMGIGNNRQWETFCKMFEHPEWSTDCRFKTNKDRVKNRAILVEMLNRKFSTSNLEEWLNALSMAGIPAAPINRLDQVFANPQVIARQMRITLTDDRGNTIPQVGSPLKIPTAPPQYRLPPPKLGASTEELLHQLAGLSPTEIQQLREQKII
jgi:formyl-CoA transferase